MKNKLNNETIHVITKAQTLGNSHKEFCITADKTQSCVTPKIQEPSWWHKPFSVLYLALQLFMSKVCAFLARLSRVRVSYTPLIAALLLAFLAKDGVLTDFPALEWIGEVILRLWNWGASILHSIVQWVLASSDDLYTDWPILGQLVEWIRYILIG